NFQTKSEFHKNDFHVNKDSQTKERKKFQGVIVKAREIPSPVFAFEKRSLKATTTDITAENEEKHTIEMSSENDEHNDNVICEITTRDESTMQEIVPEYEIIEQENELNLNKMAIQKLELQSDTESFNEHSVDTEELSTFEDILVPEVTPETSKLLVDTNEA